MSVSEDGGESWSSPGAGSHGYRSCVAWAGPARLVAVGTTGLDYSQDSGQTWHNLVRGHLGWNSVAVDPDTSRLWVAGNNGTLVTVELKQDDTTE